MCIRDRISIEDTTSTVQNATEGGSSITLIALMLALFVVLIVVIVRR